MRENKEIKENIYERSGRRKRKGKKVEKVVKL